MEDQVTERSKRPAVIGQADLSAATGDFARIAYGGDKADTLYGLGGADLLAGGGGADTIQGGEGDDAVLWRPGEGDDEIHGGAGQDVLRLEQTGLTLGQLRDAIVLQDGSRPQIVDGRLLLGGQAGAVTIGAETIRFDGIDEIQLSEFTPFMYGR